MISHNNLLIVDSRNLIDRFWYATSDTEKATKLYIKTIKNAIEKFSISHAVFTFDSESKETFRHSYYDKYKESRDPTPDEIISIKNSLYKELPSIFGGMCIEHKHYEADDFVASASKFGKENGFLSFILSTDKDLHQLVDPTTFVVDFSKNLKVLNENEIFLKYDFQPEYILDYLSIMGDTSDDIPGVLGIGKVGATKLIKEYGNLKSIYQNIEDIKPAGTKKKLIEGKEQARLSYVLVSLQSSLLGEFVVEQFQINKTNV